MRRHGKHVDAVALGRPLAGGSFQVVKPFSEPISSCRWEAGLSSSERAVLTLKSVGESGNAGKRSDGGGDTARRGTCGHGGSRAGKAPVGGAR